MQKDWQITKRFGVTFSAVTILPMGKTLGGLCLLTGSDLEVSLDLWWWSLSCIISWASPLPPVVGETWDYWDDFEDEDFDEDEPPTLAQRLQRRISRLLRRDVD